jgi:hypothetical protein
MGKYAKRFNSYSPCHVGLFSLGVIVGNTNTIADNTKIKPTIENNIGLKHWINFTTEVKSQIGSLNLLL